MDEEDEEFFLLAFLEDERERRRELGILGCWPIYEFNQRVRFDEAFAQRVAIIEAIIGLAVIPLYVIYVLPVVLRLGWMIIQAGMTAAPTMPGS